MGFSPLAGIIDRLLFNLPLTFIFTWLYNPTGGNLPPVIQLNAVALEISYGRSGFLRGGTGCSTLETIKVSGCELIEGKSPDPKHVRLRAVEHCVP